MNEEQMRAECAKIEAEWKMGGLTGGVYEDFAVALAKRAVAAERERWQRDQQAWEDTRTQRDELLAHIAGKAPLPQWAADWLKA